MRAGAHCFYSTNNATKKRASTANALSPLAECRQIACRIMYHNQIASARRIIHLIFLEFKQRCAPAGNVILVMLTHSVLIIMQIVE